MLFAPVLAFHTGNNKNGSCVTEKAANKAIKKLAYKPVLANFCEIDGVRDFTSHDFEVDEDGNYVYYEKQVGCFTADKPCMENDQEHKDRKNVFAKVAIPRQYTDAADIIERKNGTDASVELSINEMSWDSKEKVLILDDVDVMGITLLGHDPETGRKVNPGMENAGIKLEDFSLENNSLTFNSKLINEIADAVADRINSTNTTRKEESKLDFDNNIEDTKIEEMEVESVEEQVTDVVTDESSEVVNNYDDSGDVDNVADVDDVTDGGEDEVGDIESEETVAVESENQDEIISECESDKRRFSINDMVFEVSLSEIQYALYELVNNTYGESDNDYYCVEVYEGSKTVVMCGLFTGRNYRQSYKVRNGVYSLVGDRVSVKAVYVTSDEEAELDKMRGNYAEISDKLQKYESEPEKMEILNSSDYANIADQADFAELKKQENHFDLTVDELKAQADAMLLAYAKSGKLNFAVIEPEKKEEPRKDFFAFAKVNHDSSFLDGLLNNKR
jgi:hypothetical protein